MHRIFDNQSLYVFGRAMDSWGVALLRLLTAGVSSWVASQDQIYGRYLVDPASSHMLVSKIKPCMSKYKLLIL